MGIVRQKVCDDDFNPDGVFAYALRKEDFAIAMQDVYDFFGDVNERLAEKGLGRLEDTMLRAISLRCKRMTSGAMSAAHWALERRHGTGSSRAVAASLSVASGAVEVTVTCSAAGHASASETVTLTLRPVIGDACLTDLGSLGAGTVVRAGGVVADSGCVSWKLGTSAAPHYARRFALGVASASSVTVSASSSAVDVHVHVLEGSGPSAVVVGSDDDGGSGTDALVSGVSLEPATSYVVEVTTAAPRDTGAFTLSVAVVAVAEAPRVRSVTVSAAGACSPAARTLPEGVDAAYDCALTLGAARTVTATANANHATISAAWTATGGATATAAAARAAAMQPDGSWQTTATAEVACTAHGTATITVTAGAAANTDTRTARLDINCATAVRITGLDDTTETGTVTVTVADTFTVAPAAAACTAAAAAGTPTVADGTGPADRSVSVRLAAGAASAVTVTCTHAGLPDATATATLTAAPIPQITDVTVTATTGGTCIESAGTAPDGIDAVYACTATLGDALGLSVTADASTDGPTLAWTAHTAVAVGSPTQSTSAEQILAPGSSLPAWRRTGTAQLVCTAAGTATLRVALTGADDHVTRLSVACEAPSEQTCSQDLGSLGAGATRRTGTIAADAACVSAQRHASTNAIVYYARRHTFSLASATTITIDLESAATNERFLDTYLLLLRGTNGTNSEFVRRDDDGGASTNSRITAVSLPAGAYTIEATTYGYKKTGDYTLTVTVTVTGPAVADTIALTGLPAADCAQTNRALPDGIHQAWTCTQHSDDDYTVTGTAATSSDTVSLAWTTTAGVTATGAADLGLSQPDELHTAYRRSSRTALGCTADGTATLTATIGAGAARTAKAAEITVDCVTPVQITGLDDSTASGTGTVAVADAFTVAPAAAACVSSPSGTVSAPGGAAAGSRVLSADIAAPGSAEVSVRCTAAGYLPSSEDVVLTALFSEPCLADLGRVGNGVTAGSGTIAADAACTSVRRRHPGSVGSRTYYTRWHTFSLDSPGWVTVTLESAASNSRRLDPYLILLGGHAGDGSGAHIDHNDDHRSGYDTHRWNSRLVDRFLQPGDYTIEATSYYQNRTGDYTLTVDATVTGLRASYDAVVGEQLMIGLGTSDVVAEVRSITPSTLAWSTGSAGLALTAGLADTHRVGVALAKSAVSSRSSTRSARSVMNATTAETFEFDVAASCGAGLVTSDRNGRVCVPVHAQTSATSYPEDRVTETGRGSKYPVTLGTLWGVKNVARDARDAYMNPSPGVTRACTPTANRIAAIMLSVPLFEVPNIESNTYLRHPARSPMALSRWDRDHDALYSDNDKTSGPARAFWNPGVGLWQLDDTWASAARALSHGERAEIHIGGRLVAEYLAGQLCAVAEGGIKAKLKTILDPPWLACVDKGQTPYEHRCYEWSYLKLWVKATDDLHVTSHSTEYPGGTLDYRSDFSTSGGLSKLECRWGSSGNQFPCWFYDTDNPEGWMLDEDPAAVATSQTPLAAPFMSFAEDGNRFAVFPESFLGTQTTLIKAVPVAANARNATVSSWTPDRYRNRVLHVEVCRVIAVEAGSVCKWVSTTLNSGRHTFARTLRDAGH